VRVAEPQIKKQNRQAPRPTPCCCVARARGLPRCKWRWGRDTQRRIPTCTAAVRTRERNYSASRADAISEGDIVAWAKRSDFGFGFSPPPDNRTVSSSNRSE
jgi:hypothetical protein